MLEVVVGQFAEVHVIRTELLDEPGLVLVREGCEAEKGGFAFVQSSADLCLGPAFVQYVQ